MNNKHAALEYIFKKYGKENTTKWIRGYFTTRINIQMPVFKIINTLWVYGFQDQIENAYKDYSEETIIDIGLFKYR